MYLTKQQTTQIIKDCSECITYVCNEYDDIDNTILQDKLDIMEICVAVLGGTYTNNGDGTATYNNDARGVCKDDFNTLDTAVRDDLIDYFGGSE